MESEHLGRREHGRFRSFLLKSFKNFSADQRDRDQAQKRGGPTKALLLDASEGEKGLAAALVGGDTPETLFERRWAHALLRTTLEDVRISCEADGAGRMFEALRGSLAGRSDESYRTIAAHLGMTEGALKVAAHRLRAVSAGLFGRRWGEPLTPSEVEDELRSRAAMCDDISPCPECVSPTPWFSSSPAFLSALS